MIRSYLLGELPESALDKIEERILIDDAYFLKLQLVEEDLIDEYVQDSLPAREREKFQQHFLSTPERIRSVKFARALGKYVKEAQATELPLENDEFPRQTVPKRSFLASLQASNPALRWSLLAALLLIIAGISWTIIKVLRAPNPSESIQAQKTVPQEEPSPQNVQSPTSPDVSNARPIPSPTQSATPVRQDSNKPANQPRITTPATPPSKGSSYAILLSPGMTRGDDGVTPVEVPAGASSVDFQLILMGNRYSSYRASLFKGDQEISSWNRVKAVNGKSGNYALVSAPVKSISNGSYYILLNGVTANGDLQVINRYYFRISKK